MPFLFRVLILWSILLGCCVLIPRVMDSSPVPDRDEDVLGLFSLPFAVVVTCWASHRLAARAPARILFWTITGGLWVLIGLLFVGGLHEADIRGRLPTTGILFAALVATPVGVQFALFRHGLPPRHRGWFWSFYLLTWVILLLFVCGLLVLPSAPWLEELRSAHYLYLSVQLAGIVAISLQLHLRRWPSHQTQVEILTGLALLPLIAAVSWLDLTLHLRTERRRALAAWAARGEPLERFEESLVPALDSYSATLMQDVTEKWAQARQPPLSLARIPPGIRGILTFKTGSGTANLPSKWLRADEFDLLVRGFGAEEENFRADCEKMLRVFQALPLTFAWHPMNGSTRWPPVRGAQAFNQLAILYAATRLAAGDETGAPRGLAVARHLFEAFPDAAGYPTHIGLKRQLEARLDQVKMEARFTHVEDSPAAIQRDLADWLQRLQHVARYHAWRRLHWWNADSLDGDRDRFIALPPSLNTFFTRWGRKVEGARIARQLANPLAPPTDLSVWPDERDRSFAEVFRLIHEVSLQREQSDLIRTARARLAQGLPLESRPSAVFPEATWKLDLNAKLSIVTFSLTGAPGWTQPELGSEPWRLTWKYRHPAVADHGPSIPVTPPSPRAGAGE